MNPARFSFQPCHADAGCAARTSVFHTPHGPVELPAFMPVGTLGTVKGLEIEQVRATGLRVETGRFQEHMMVEIHNDCPVTILLDSREKTESSG